MKKNFDIYIDSEMYGLIPKSLQSVFRKLVVDLEFIDDIVLSSSYYHFVIARRKKSSRQEILKVARMLLSQASFYYKSDDCYMKYSACKRLALNLLESLV